MYSKNAPARRKGYVRMRPLNVMAEDGSRMPQRKTVRLLRHFFVVKLDGNEPKLLSK